MENLNYIICGNNYMCDLKNQYQIPYLRGKLNSVFFPSGNNKYRFISSIVRNTHFSMDGRYWNVLV